MHFISCLTLALLLLSPLAVLATPAITCHCFTDRSYDPANPTLADPYFLATTQNSFFAAAYGVDKKSIVIKKQKGMTSADLWVAYQLASRSGKDPEALLRARKAKGNWRLAAAQAGIPAKALGERFAAALQANAADERLADLVVDDLLLRFRIYGEAELAAMRKAGAGNQELILAAMVAARTRQPALKLYGDVKSGSRSWGGLLDRARIPTGDIQKQVDLLVKRS